MKLMAISVHFEYGDIIEQILDDHQVRDYLLFPMMQGKDRDGKHHGSQVHPGNFVVFHAQVPDEKIDPLLNRLHQFREEKQAHRHLEAIITPIERRL